MSNSKCTGAQLWNSQTGFKLKKKHYSSEKLFKGSTKKHLLLVIKQLKDGCTVCGELQNIAHLETETIIGLGRIFYLKCICGNINAIYSGQYQNRCGENRECKIFDVNTQCAGG